MKNSIAAFMIAAAFVCPLSAYAEFIDMPDDSIAADALNKAVENGLLTGISDTEIAPYSELTRAQLAVILSRSLGAANRADISAFTDVNTNDWFYDGLSCAVKMGAVKGDGERLNPNDSVTIEQAFLVLSRVFDLNYTSPSAADDFSDSAEISSWAKDGVNKIVYGGYWKSTGELTPQKLMTRAEFAIVMNNLVSDYITEPGTYSQKYSGNILVKSENVKIENAETDGDIFVADGVSGTTKILNSVAERVVVRGGRCEISGTFSWLRAIEDNTSLVIDLDNTFLKSNTKDGEKGKFYADGTKENCKIDFGTIGI